MCKKGHCFDDSTLCFKHNNTDLRNYLCDYFIGAADHRVEAGWLGITKEECVKKGNCFDKQISNAKFCFKKNLGA